MTLKSISLTLVLSVLCSCSSTAPIVVHSEYGEMSADDERFRFAASECAIKSRQKVSEITLNEYSKKPEYIFGGIQLISFFKNNDGCIKSKNWRLKQ